MSNKELCIKIIDEFPENQLINVLNMLKDLKSFLETSEDDNFCNNLLNEYNECTDSDKGEVISIQDFSKELGFDTK